MDWRFKVANREAWIGVALAAINFLWWYGFAYGLGSGPVSEYQFIFGMPAWFFLQLCCWLIAYDCTRHHRRKVFPN